MALKFTTTAKGGDFAKILVYGVSGVGKTELAGTAPDPIIISSEKKLISLADKNIPVILIETADDLEAAYIWVTTNEKAARFKTVVVDSISDIAETILAHFKENPVDGNSHGQAAYGSMADAMSPMIKKFRDINTKNLYFIAKSKMVEDVYTNVNMFSPSLPGKVLPGNIAYEFDYVFAMRIGETEKGSKYRYLQTQPDMQWMAKGSRKLRAVEKPDLTNIFRKLTSPEKPKPKKTKETEKPENEKVEAEAKPEKASEKEVKPEQEAVVEETAVVENETGFETKK